MAHLRPERLHQNTFLIVNIQPVLQKLWIFHRHVPNGIPIWHHIPCVFSKSRQIHLVQFVRLNQFEI